MLVAARRANRVNASFMNSRLSVWRYISTSQKLINSSFISPYNEARFVALGILAEEWRRFII
jgi:hypothetical protein